MAVRLLKPVSHPPTSYLIEPHFYNRLIRSQAAKGWNRYQAWLDSYQ